MCRSRWSPLAQGAHYATRVGHSHNALPDTICLYQSIHSSCKNCNLRSKRLLRGPDHRQRRLQLQQRWQPIAQSVAGRHFFKHVEASTSEQSVSGPEGIPIRAHGVDDSACISADPILASSNPVHLPWLKISISAWVPGYTRPTCPALAFRRGRAYVVAFMVACSGSLSSALCWPDSVKRQTNTSSFN